jgi:hypothetical protein
MVARLNNSGGLSEGIQMGVSMLTSRLEVHPADLRSMGRVCGVMEANFVLYGDSWRIGWS